MTIENLSDQNRLKLHHDPEDGTTIIPGREGQSHLFEYSDDLLGVMVMPETGTAHRWRLARPAFESAGMVIRQAGDFEGTATFDPANPEQVKLAMKFAKVRPKRQLSPGHRDNLLAASQDTRFPGSDTVLNGELTS
jgi:hypothetical protein